LFLASGLLLLAPGFEFLIAQLASCYWFLVTESKILEMNRGFGNLGAYIRKLAATGQGQETSSQ